MLKETFSSGLWVFAQFEESSAATTVRHRARTIEAAALVPGLKGIEFISPLHVSLENAVEVKGWLEELTWRPFLSTPTCGPSRMAPRRLHFPGFTRALGGHRSSKEAVGDWPRPGLSQDGPWPGEDGFDTHFQANYSQQWEWEAEGVREIAEFDPETLIGIEYKIEEPCNPHQLISNAAKAALLGEALRLPNVGAYLDFGHALMGERCPQKPWPC